MVALAEPLHGESPCVCHWLPNPEIPILFLNKKKEKGKKELLLQDAVKLSLQMAPKANQRPLGAFDSADDATSLHLVRV